MLRLRFLAQLFLLTSLFVSRSAVFADDLVMIQYADGTKSSCEESQCVCDYWQMAFYATGDGDYTWGGLRGSTAAEVQEMYNSYRDQAYQTPIFAASWDRMHARVVGPYCKVNRNSPTPTLSLSPDVQSNTLIVAAAKNALQYWNPRIQDAIDLSQRANALINQSIAFRDNPYGAGWAVVEYFGSFRDVLMKYRELQALMRNTGARSASTIAEIAALTNDLNADQNQYNAALNNLGTPASGFGAQCMSPFDQSVSAKSVPVPLPLCGTVQGSIVGEHDLDNDYSNSPLEKELISEDHQLVSADEGFGNSIDAIVNGPPKYARGSLAEAVDQVLQAILAAQKFNFEIQSELLNITRDTKELANVRGFQLALNREKALERKLIQTPTFKAVVASYHMRHSKPTSRTSVARVPRDSVRHLSKASARSSAVRSPAAITKPIVAQTPAPAATCSAEEQNAIEQMRSAIAQNPQLLQGYQSALQTMEEECGQR